MDEKIYMVVESGYETHYVMAVKKTFEEAREYVENWIVEENKDIIRGNQYMATKYPQYRKEKDDPLYEYNPKSPYFNDDKYGMLWEQYWAWHRPNTTHSQFHIEEYIIGSEIIRTPITRDSPKSPS